MNLWLDDMRPAPEGWHHVKTVDEAKALLVTGEVERAGLDHDLGACDECMDGTASVEQWLEDHNYVSMPHCHHFGTGYDLVSWMEETGHWPKERPTVHSANPVGKAAMLTVIAKRYGDGR